MTDTQTDHTETVIEALEAAGYRVIPPSTALDEQLRDRMEGLARDLQMIGGLTTRGAKLPEEYRRTALLSTIRAFDRLFVALSAGRDVAQPWSIDR